LPRKTPRNAAWLILAPLCLGAAAPVGTKSKSGVDQSILQTQVILDHLGFAPGVLDGKSGQSLTAAVKGFQESRGLAVTGKLDEATQAQIDRYRGWSATRTLRLSADSLAGPFINPLPSKPADQAKLPALAYRSKMEKLAEMFHTTPAVLIALNSPDTSLAPGTPVVFPNALPTSRAYDAKLPADWRKTLNDLNVDAVQPQGTKVVVDKSDQVLRVLAADDHLIAQFSATMGSEHDPLPIGAWKIQGFSYNPKSHYNPALFWDAKATDKAATLPPGPNGPVGVIWIDLSKPHYGSHGTPEPTTIGRAESHGCIRLTNWDAARLSLMIKPGTPAVFRE